MSIIKQNSRIQHHRLTTTSLTFTVPSSEDFTDGTWADTDLMLGEFGVNLTDNRFFVRTTSGIFELAATSGVSALWVRDGSGNIVPTDDGGSPVVNPNIVPEFNNVSDLGTGTTQWKNLFLSGMCQVGSFSGSALPTASKGTIIFNTSTNKLICWDGSTWQNLF